MGLEAGTLIPDLDPNNPLGSDVKSEGDDHLRLVKRCVQGSFPAFVGTTAVPKSVSLTEDQLSDAAQKSAAQTISGAWRHTNDLSFDNDTFIFMDTAGNAQLVRMMSVTGANIMQFGSNQGFAVDGEMLFAGEFEFIRGGSLSARMVDPSLGGILINNRLNSSARAVGLRGAGSFDIATSLTLRQDHEETTIFATGAAQGFSAPQLLLGTTIRIVTEFSATGTLVTAGAGVTIRTHQGGGQFGGNIAIAPSSVCELVWRSTTEVRAWGNGLTPSP